MAQTFRFEVDPEARVEDISVGQQQRVEIMKALYRNADILILDEPTAVLTPQEASDLFGSSFRRASRARGAHTAPSVGEMESVAEGGLESLPSASPA